MRTLEQRFLFDSGLCIGLQTVTIVRKCGTKYDALVEIGKRGAVYVLPKPTESDMYLGWYRIKGDEVKPHGNVLVWPFRNENVMARFGVSVCEISFKSE